MLCETITRTLTGGLLLLGGPLAPQEAPAPVDEQEAAVLEEVTITRRTEAVLGVDVSLRECGPEDGPDVLLLHGAAFHSGTWEELGTLAHLARAELHVVAVDLPGYGKTPSLKGERAEFLAELIPALELERPVLVFPSMSGGFAFPLLVSQPELVGGMVPVAPVGTPQFAPQLKGKPIRALIIWGENDRLFPPTQADLLVAALENSEKLILPGARHPAYLDRPKEFHEAVVRFVKSLGKTKMSNGEEED